MGHQSKGKAKISGGIFKRCAYTLQSLASRPEGPAAPVVSNAVDQRSVAFTQSNTTGCTFSGWAGSGTWERVLQVDV